MALKDLAPKHLALAECMSAISERCYCAGWKDDLEYALWAIVTGETDPSDFGFTGSLWQSEVAMLKALAEWCGGWIVWDDDTEDTFVPMDEWLKRYEAYKYAAYKAKH